MVFLLNDETIVIHRFKLARTGIHYLSICVTVEQQQFVPRWRKGERESIFV